MANRLVSTVTAAASVAFAITPTDGVDLTSNTRALWIGGAGTLTVNMAGDGNSVLFSGISAGTLLPIQVSRVSSTGTTATLIVGLN
jgi:hypothetical protein